MQKFTKKPVTVEAIQVPGCGEQPSQELIDLVHENNWDGDDNGICIGTLEGDMVADAGDWIIRGVKGEFYPCKPDIFEMTYHVADDRPFSADEAMARLHKAYLSGDIDLHGMLNMVGDWTHGVWGPIEDLEAS